MVATDDVCTRRAPAAAAAATTLAVPPTLVCHTSRAALRRSV